MKQINPNSTAKQGLLPTHATGVGFSGSPVARAHQLFSGTQVARVDQLFSGIQVARVDQLFSGSQCRPVI